MKSLSLSLALVGAAAAQQSAWGQCGGIGYSGVSSCGSSYYCSTQNPYYAQCIPGTATAASSSQAPTTLRTTTTTTTTTSNPSVPSTTTTTTTTSQQPGNTGSAPSPPPSTGGSGKVKYAGVNIAGFDFGCNSAGECSTGGFYDIVRDDNGVQQMQHLASIGLNAFRLPIGWQYIVNYVLGGPINTTSDYYTLVDACLATTAQMCIIDLHNYARWNNAIVGQGGPTNAQFANVWSQIATKYASESRIAFDVMNEPHDLPSIPIWAQSVQAAVTAIRQAGATSQIILLPGDNWTSAGTFVSGGSAAALNSVTNPDGTTTNLVMNVHKYLDSDNSGTTTDCVTNNIADAFAPLATWLRANGRKAMLTETGGGNNAGCETYMCQELAYLNQNSDVYLGWTGWAAGGFYPGSYALDEVPVESSSGVWTDTPLVVDCIAGEFLN